MIPTFGADKAMNDSEFHGNATPALGPIRIVEQLRGWWRGTNPDEEYLSAATDLFDLERRMRLLDRGNRGPVFETFNH